MRSVARPFQRRWQPLVALAAVAAAMIGCERLSPEERAAAEAHEQWQLVDRYCVDCHNDAELAGELSLDSLSPDSIAANPATFEKVVRKLRGHLMPPPKEPRPDEQQLWSFVSWVEASLDRAAVDRVPQRIALHRLNRKEYSNAVRDLLDLPDRCRRDPAARRAGRGLRQHRGGAAGVAVVHRAVLDRGANGGAASRRPRRCPPGQHDLQRRAGHAARAHSGPAARDARRHPRGALLSVRRRVRHRHRGHGGPHLGQRHGVREHRARDARQQRDLPHRDRR